MTLDSNIGLISFEDVLDAHKRIRGYLNPTPLMNFKELDAIVGHGIKVWVKPEILQPTCSFKVRNAIGGLTAMDQNEKSKGVIAASTGNLGQGLAYAGQLLNIPVTICVKKNNNPQKNAAILKWGAKIVEHGDTYDEAHDYAISNSGGSGPMYISTSKNKFAFAGAATLGLEIFSEQIPIDRIIHPVGSGSHATGTAIVGRVLSPATKIVGIQAANAATIHDYWHHKATISPVTETIADALSLGPEFYAWSLHLLQDKLQEFLTATEGEILAAIRILYKTTDYIVEPAGAIGLAGIIANSERWHGESIVTDLSGGNLNSNLRYILD